MEEQFYSLDLPSKLKSYSNLGVNEVKIRMLKGRDEKFLGELSLTNFDKKYALLLSQVLKGIDPKELTLGDRMYIALWLSMNCYTYIYPIQVTCEHCLQKTDVDVDLRKLPKIELPDNFVEPYPVKLSDGSTVHLRLLRVKDEISYADYVANKKSAEPNYRLALTMVDDRNILDRIQFLDGLSVRDLSILRAFHDSFIHGVDLDSYSYECTKCKEVGSTPVPFRIELLFPDGQTVAKTTGNSF